MPIINAFPEGGGGGSNVPTGYIPILLMNGYQTISSKNYTITPYKSSNKAYLYFTTTWAGTNMTNLNNALAQIKITPIENIGNLQKGEEYHMGVSKYGSSGYTFSLINSNGTTVESEFTTAYSNANIEIGSL